ncbi:MAG TPA: tetratricopeptide repeat protein [Jatrophihabitantaceae bacterium]|nr:tetratricopeptide repeat protein [Jatrophihabitantaceae bacterium]
MPHELPPDIVGYSGRASSLETLDGVLGASTTPKVVIICGTAGVGKTALAVHWAHRHAAQFPDGQIYVNLRGYDVGAPIEALDAAGMLLRSLLPAGATIPPDEHARISLYRSLTADRRLLILLDNASAAAQVRPLLAAGGGCLVVITSRDAMSGLVARDGAQRLELDVLSPAESTALLAAFVGDRARAEPDAIAELARSCAYLPLGLRLAAELTASRPQLALADHLADLDAAETLDQLDAGGDEQTSLRAVFSWSYVRLPLDAARAFRLLGAHPGRDYDGYALAALVDVPLGAARSLIRTLQRAHLLEESAPGRYTMHDLLHAYAVDLASHDPERGAASARLLDYYIWCATTVHQMLHAYDPRRLTLDPHLRPSSVPDLTTPDHAQFWFDSERPNLVAAVRSAPVPRLVIDLAAAVDRQLNVGGHYPEDAIVLEAALTAAQAIGDRPAEGAVVMALGRVLGQTARYADAIECLTRSCDIADELGDRAISGSALISFGCVYYDLGEYGQATEALRKALALATELGLPWLEASALGNLGLCHGSLGLHETALDLFTRALASYRKAGSRPGEGSILDSIGSTHRQLGHPVEAIDHHARALGIARETGSVSLEIGAMSGLGRASLAAQRHHEALGYYESALRLAHRIGDRFETAQALDGLGELALVRHRHDEARARWNEAYELCLEIGIPLANDVRAKLDQLNATERSTRAG